MKLIILALSILMLSSMFGVAFAGKPSGVIVFAVTYPQTYKFNVVVTNEGAKPIASIKIIVHSDPSPISASGVIVTNYADWTESLTQIEYNTALRLDMVADNRKAYLTMRGAFNQMSWEFDVYLTGVTLANLDFDCYAYDAKGNQLSYYENKAYYWP